MKEGYKICYSFNGNALSSMGTSLWNGGIYYYIGEIVYPSDNHGPLCVFDDLESAETFYRDYCKSRDHYKIFLCEYEESNHDMVWCSDWHVPVFDLPKGTKLASWVKLIEEVKL